MAKRKSDIVEITEETVPALVNTEVETQPLKNGVVVLIAPTHIVAKTELQGNVSINRNGLDVNIKIGDTVFF